MISLFLPDSEDDAINAQIMGNLHRWELELYLLNEAMVEVGYDPDVAGRVVVENGKCVKRFSMENWNETVELYEDTDQTELLDRVPDVLARVEAMSDSDVFDTLKNYKDVPATIHMYDEEDQYGYGAPLAIVHRMWKLDW